MLTDNIKNDNRRYQNSTKLYAIPGNSTICPMNSMIDYHLEFIAQKLLSFESIIVAQIMAVRFKLSFVSCKIAHSEHYLWFFLAILFRPIFYTITFQNYSK